VILRILRLLCAAQETVSLLVSTDMMDTTIELLDAAVKNDNRCTACLELALYGMLLLLLLLLLHELAQYGMGPWGDRTLWHGSMRPQGARGLPASSPPCRLPSFSLTRCAHTREEMHEILAAGVQFLDALVQHKLGRDHVNLWCAFDPRVPPCVAVLLLHAGMHYHLLACRAPTDDSGGQECHRAHRSQHAQGARPPRHSRMQG
jgi:hypothetical protein